MRYQDFLDRVARVSRSDSEKVREIMSALPEVLMALTEDEYVRTPLGVLKMKRRKRKRVLLPDGKGWTHAPEQLRIHLNPGSKMKVDVD